jgi:hypothetical protein
MTHENVELIRFLSNLSVIAPLIVGIARARLMPTENRIIFFLVTASAIADLIGFNFATSGKDTSALFNGFTSVAFIITSWYFYQVVFKFRAKAYFIVGLGVYLLAFMIAIIKSGFSLYQGELWALSGFVLVFFGIIYNNYQVEKPPLLDRNLYSGLIFNAAIMFYFSFNFFLFIIANYVLTELPAETARIAWGFHNLNNIIKNIAFAFGFYFTNRRRLNLTDEEVERIQWRHLQ